MSIGSYSSSKTGIASPDTGTGAQGRSLADSLAAIFEEMGA